MNPIEEVLDGCASSRGGCFAAVQPENSIRTQIKMRAATVIALFFI